MAQLQRLPLKNTLLASQASRGYFSFMDRVKSKVNVPMKHLKSMFEHDGQNYESQLPEGYRLHGNTAASLNAYVTENSYEMHQWHEMDSVVHYQFGTVDNPVLIFTSDSSWRIVICMGPGVEDDSHAHEKMYYYVREGVMHRCQVCGQCFKLVRLKDEDTATNDYYQMMFSQIAHFEVQEEDMMLNLTAPFGDRPQPTLQTMPVHNAYVLVNNDEHDRIMVDPAYRLAKYEKLVGVARRLQAVEQEVEKQVKNQTVSSMVSFDREMYESWFKIEKAIRKLDRVFNKVEKFQARRFADPDNFERREARMLERKRERENASFTYFFGNLTEEEQMYRDYYQTDIENDPESEVLEAQFDEERILETGDFSHKRFKFLDQGLIYDQHESYEDIVEDKIFKFKYRKATDFGEVYNKRQQRVLERFLQRLENRDPSIEQDVAETLRQIQVKETVAAVLVDEQPDMELFDNKFSKPLRDYMLAESIQQYKDYYEDDAEEVKFFEYLDEMSVRDKIRFMECFEDHSVRAVDGKKHIRIPKREPNPELSLMGNFALDFVDFKDRVRFLAKDLTAQDVAAKHQRLSREEMRAMHRDLLENNQSQEAVSEETQGYSSIEAPVEEHQEEEAPAQEEETAEKKEQ